MADQQDRPDEKPDATPPATAACAHAEVRRTRLSATPPPRSRPRRRRPAGEEAAGQTAAQEGSCQDTEEAAGQGREEGAARRPPRRPRRRRLRQEGATQARRKSHRSWPTPTASATLRMRPKKQRRKPNRLLPRRAIPRPGRVPCHWSDPTSRGCRWPLRSPQACWPSCWCWSPVATATTDKSLDPHATSGSIVAAWTPRPSVR